VRYPEDRSSTYSFRPRGLEAEKRYRVAFDNSGRSENHTGSDLMRTGLSLNLPVVPASELLLFEAVE
jgi:Glycosyl hydrolase family 36 C-terminal domain